MAFRLRMSWHLQKEIISKLKITDVEAGLIEIWMFRSAFYFSWVQVLSSIFNWTSLYLWSLLFSFSSRQSVMLSRTTNPEVEAKETKIPLRSVENQIDLQKRVTTAAKLNEKPQMEVSEDKNTANMTNPVIRSEPFLENYTVEREIGRWVSISWLPEIPVVSVLRCVPVPSIWFPVLSVLFCPICQGLVGGGTQNRNFLCTWHTFQQERSPILSLLLVFCYVGMCWHGFVAFIGRKDAIVLGCVMKLQLFAGEVATHCDVV